MEAKLKKMLRKSGTIGVLVFAGLLASCSTMSNLMGGGGQVSLSGSNEVPPTTTGASGTGSVSVNSDCNVTAKVTVTGMTATAAHIHEGAAGANGPVIVPFTKTGDNQFEAPAGAKMTPAQCASYKAGKTYVNVHSAKNPGGEVRAQLKGE
jgi:hypothetical protein